MNPFMHLPWKSPLCFALAALFASCAGSGTRSSSGRDVWGHRPGPKGFSTVIIDAGHGGHDAGATSRTTSQREKDLTLDMAKRLRTDAARRTGPAVASTLDVANVPTTCVEVPVSGGITKYCVVDNGVIAVFSGGDITIDMVAYQPQADGSLLVS